MTTPQRDWSKLRHAHGSASDVPRWLAELDSGDASERRMAAAMLRERFEAGPVSALPAVASELVERLGQASRDDRAGLWELLVAIVFAEPERYALSPFVPKKKQKADFTAALSVFSGAEPLLEEALDSKDPALCAAAAYAASFLPEPSPRLAARVAKLVRRKNLHPAEESSLLLALGTFVRRGAATHDELPAPGAKASPRMRAAHVLARAIANGVSDAPLEREEMDALALFLGQPADPASESPWGGRELGNLAAEALVAQGERAREVVPRLLAGIEAMDARLQARNRDLALDLAFASRPGRAPIAPADLDAEQKAAIELLLAAGVDVAYPRVGILNTANARGLVSGADAAEGGQRAIESELRLSAGTRPAWQWFDAVCSGEVDAQSLLQAMAARFSPAELWEVMVDAFEAKFGNAQPPMLFAEAAAERVACDAATVRSLAERLQAQGFACSPPAAVYAVKLLLRTGGAAAVIPEFEPLALVALGGNDDAAIERLLAALPKDARARLTEAAWG